MFDTSKYINELDLLDEYLYIYIQLLPYTVMCGGGLLRCQLPTFEYFKQTYSDKRYSLVIPRYKESFTVLLQKIIPKHQQGLDKVIAYREYNYWMGCKYFVTEGDRKYRATVFLNDYLQQYGKLPSAEIFSYTDNLGERWMEEISTPTIKIKTAS